MSKIYFRYVLVHIITESLTAKIKEDDGVYDTLEKVMYEMTKLAKEVEKQKNE